MPEGAQMETRMRMLELSQNTLLAGHSEFREAFNSVKESMQSLVRLEEHHNYTREALSRAFKEIDNTKTETAALRRESNERLEEIEKHMPGLIEVRGWIICCLLGIAALVGVAVIGLVIVKSGTQSVASVEIAQPPESYSYGNGTKKHETAQ